MFAQGDNPDGIMIAGFTFLGQFLDHDMTFDSTSPRTHGGAPRGDLPVVGASSYTVGRVQQMFIDDA